MPRPPRHPAHALPPPGTVEAAIEVARLDERHATHHRRAGRAAFLLVATSILGGLATWYAAVVVGSLPMAAWVGVPVAVVAFLSLGVHVLSNRSVRGIVARLANIVGPTGPDALPLMPFQVGDRIGRWMVLESTADMLHLTRSAARWVVVLQRSALLLLGFGLTVASLWTLTYHGAFSTPSSFQLRMKATLALTLLTPVWPIIAISAVLPVTFQWMASRRDGAITIEQVRLIFRRGVTVIEASDIVAFDGSSTDAFSVIAQDGSRTVLFDHPIDPPPYERGAPPDPLHAAMNRWRSRRTAAAITLTLSGEADPRLSGEDAATAVAA